MKDLFLYACLFAIAVISITALVLSIKKQKVGPQGVQGRQGRDSDDFTALTQLQKDLATATTTAGKTKITADANKTVADANKAKIASEKLRIDANKAKIASETVRIDAAHESLKNKHNNLDSIAVKLHGGLNGSYYMITDSSQTGELKAVLSSTKNAPTFDGTNYDGAQWSIFDTGSKDNRDWDDAHTMAMPFYFEKY